MGKETAAEQGGFQKTWVRVMTTAMTATVMALIFFFSTESAEQSDRTSGRIAMQVIRAVYPEYENYTEEEQQEIYNDIQYKVRKAAHFTEYTVLGTVIRLCLESWFGTRKWLIPVSWTAGAMYACTDELHQLLSDGRSGQWQDVLLDSFGVFTGILLTSLVVSLIRRRLKRKKAAKLCP